MDLDRIIKADKEDLTSMSTMDHLIYLKSTSNSRTRTTEQAIILNKQKIINFSMREILIYLSKFD